MKKSVTFLSIAVFTSALLIQPLNAANDKTVVKSFSVGTLQDRNSITGFVFGENRTPIADAFVELLDDIGMTVSRSKTNGSGLYNFRGLADGRYNIKVMYPSSDYETQIQSVSLISLSVIAGRGSASEQVDFYLKRKKAANSEVLTPPEVVFVQEVPQEAKKLYEAGLEDLAKKDEANGFDKLKKALEIFPDYFMALERLGKEYVNRGYFQASYVLFTKAVEVNPKSFSSTFGLGLSAYRLQQYEQAIKVLQRATEVDGKSVNAFLWLGINYLQIKNFSQAETALEKANKLSNGESADVHWQLARLYNEQKRFKESADSLELYLKYKSDADAEKIKQTISTLRQKTKSN